ncbi:MAG: LysR family transcriptional regulator [Cyclobacteriaceae bacterium]
MGYQLELRHLKYFKVVAEELHYRKASEKLFISQPGLSRQIKQMEETLGVLLLERNKRKVSLTEAGRFLKGEVDFIFNHLEFTKKQLKLIERGEDGELRIGFLGSAMQKVVPDLLLKMNKIYPGISTSLEEMSNTLQVEAIEKDKLDLGFVRMDRVPQGIRMKPVYEDTFSVVVAENHPIGVANFTGIGQFADENFILFSKDYSPAYYNKIMSICEEGGFSPHISHKSVHAHTIFKLVELGLGISIVPTSLKHGFDLKVKLIELSGISQTALLSLIWKESNRSNVLKKVLELI